MIALKFNLRQIRLDRGGYDSSGAYWGRCSGPLYQAHTDDHGCERWLRARNREDAKLTIRREFPNATFYR